MNSNMKQAALNKKKMSQEAYARKQDPIPFCQVNYEGTSGGMEPTAATRMWGRSLQHHMRYMSFISDGDSSAFLAIKGLKDLMGQIMK